MGAVAELTAAPADNAHDTAAIAQSSTDVLTAPEEEDHISEQEKTERKEAVEFLKRAPKVGVVRYTFNDFGSLGLRLSQDVPPWILEVRDGSLSAKKAPRVPIAGIIEAVNGRELTQENCQKVVMDLQKRPVVLD